MGIKEITEEAIKEAQLEKVPKKAKEAYVKQLYFSQHYEFLTREEVINELKLDGVIEE